ISDPAASVVRSLMARYPKINAKLLVGIIEAGLNPKVNNMLRSYDCAKYDLILISDSNVRVGSGYLKRMVAHMSTSIGMVTSVVAGVSPKGLGGALEATYLNTFYARMMHFTARCGESCVVGKSMLFRKSIAKRFGGIRTLACYLAEDYMAGEAMKKLGYEVV